MNCFGIEIVLCNLYLKSFDLTKGLLFENFRNYCLVQIVSWWSLSIGVQIIFTTNKWYTGLKTWNEMQPRLIVKRIFYENNAPQARFSVK